MQGIARSQLAVSRSDAPAEREATRVAESVTGQPDGSTANRTSDNPARDRTGGERRRASTKNTSERTLARDTARHVRRGVDGPGRRLPTNIRTAFESTLAADFSEVRIHTGSDANVASQAINANAYTVGSDIGFASGKYDPDTTSGKRLLAHELVHVRQQRGDSPSTVMRQEAGNSEATEEFDIEEHENRIIELYVQRELDVDDPALLSGDIEILEAQDTMHPEWESGYYIYDRSTGTITPLSDVVDVDLLQREHRTAYGTSVFDDPEGYSFPDYIDAAQDMGDTNRQQMWASVVDGFAQVQLDIEYDILRQQRAVRDQLDERLRDDFQPLDLVDGTTKMLSLLGFKKGRAVVELIVALEKVVDALSVSPGLSYSDLMTQELLLVLNGQALDIRAQLNENQQYAAMMREMAHWLFAAYADLWGSNAIDLRDFPQTPEQFAAAVQAEMWLPELFPEDPELVGIIDGGKAIEYYATVFQETFEQLRWSRFPESPEECITHHNDPSVPGPEAFPAYDFESIAEDPIE